MAGGVVSAPMPAVRTVFAALEREGRVAANWPERVTTALAAEADTPPWYVRVLVGFGAWLASLLLIAFVVSSSFRSESTIEMFPNNFNNLLNGIVIFEVE